MGATKKKPSAKASTIDVSFSAAELGMLRDALGVVMPTVGKNGELGEGCVAEHIAISTGRVELERKLWIKIVKACDKLDVVTGEKAPTFAVSAAHIPALHVYRLDGE